MKIENARIIDVKAVRSGEFKFDDKHKMIFTMVLETEWGNKKIEFDISQHDGMQRLIQILIFTNSYQLQDAIEHVIRIVVENDKIIAIGDPIKNSCFNVKGDFAKNSFEVIINKTLKN